MGGVSGVASVALIAIIHQTLRAPNVSSGILVGLFTALCLVVLLTRIGSEVLLKRLGQDSISQTRMGLCRRILQSPLRRLEEIGDYRLLASLTGDVATISFAMNGVPVLCVNVIILFCGAAYLGWLSSGLLVGAIVVCALGVGSYLYSAAFARRYLRRSREAHDDLLKHIQSMTKGLKELKIHHARRRDFVNNVLDSANTEVCQNQFIGQSLQGAAIIWGRLFFFVAIGLLLFAWPKIRHIDVATLTGYTITILYLMAPLERIMAYLPLMALAKVSVDKIKRLGLMLEENEPETSEVTPIRHWGQIELAGITHSYQREGEDHGFLLGPIDLTICPGETVFVVGGNGSGKTTLIKLLTGLYVPEAGEIRLDGQPITSVNRESYRQLFSAVFDDAVLFDSLMGIDIANLDGRARDYLRELELDRVVTVKDGVFSTTELSRGQCKRLALLTAYLEDRPIYVFDEWAADQDPLFKKLFYLKLLPDIRSRGKAVVAITHDDRYFSAADRVIKLEDGRVTDSSSEYARCASSVPDL
jgi:putative ATP-binding cassette transporter